MFTQFLLLIVACLLALVACTPAASPSAPAGPAAATGPAIRSLPLTALPKVEGVVVGDTMAEWKNQGLVLHAFAGEGRTLRPAGEFCVSARLGWDDAGLLLHVDVVDSTPVEARDDNRLYEGDSVELFLMSSDPAAGMAQIVAAPGRTQQHPEPRLKFLDYRSKEARAASSQPFGPDVTVDRNDHGYHMDLLLPWAALNIKPRPGTVIAARFAVNDAAATDEKGNPKDLQRAIWLNHQTSAEWMNLSPLVLTAPGATLSQSPEPAAGIAVWGGYDDFQTTYINALADPEFTGRKVSVLAGDTLLAAAALTRDGPRAVAALAFPVLPVGQTFPPLRVLLDGAPLRMLALPDLVKLRKDAFLSAGAFRRGANGFTPTGPEIFSGDAFPACDYSDPARIRRVVGSYTLRTEFYDPAFKQVDMAATPGRYGAITTVTSAAGDKVTVYRTLYRLSPDEVAKAGQQAAVLAYGHEIQAAVSDFAAAKADRDWWHALRKTLHTEIKYEYFVRAPKAYDDDNTKLWPVIFYLHGSGGGVKLEDVQNGGIQLMAKKDPAFPFLAVSLRSPGGWYQPAVKDVIEEVRAKYRIDPARIYLTGFSMGGMGTWSVALDEPETFAAIVPIGGSDGGEGGARNAARIAAIPTWVINGQADTTTTSANAMKMVRALQALHAPVQFTEIPDANHVESHVIAYQWPKLYEWLLQQKKNR